jgi:hypothetical protein
MDNGDKRDRKPFPLLYGIRNPYRNFKPEKLKIMPRTSTKLYFHENGFITTLDKLFRN